MDELVGSFNQEKALVGAFFVIVKSSRSTAVHWASAWSDGHPRVNAATSSLPAVRCEVLRRETIIIQQKYRYHMTYDSWACTYSTTITTRYLIVTRWIKVGMFCPRSSQAEELRVVAVVLLCPLGLKK